MSKIDQVLGDITKVKKDEKPIVISKLSDPSTLSRVNTKVPTRNLALDSIMGGGWPVRRIIEVYGDNSTGKTYLGTDACISTQEMGGLAVYADIEVALGYDRMVDLGVDPDNLIYAAPDTIDDVMKLLDKTIEAKNKYYGHDAVLTFVFDSVAALATQDELEADGYEERQYPNAARYLSGSMRKLKHVVAENNVLLFLINQTRQKLGVLFGDGATTYGGNAIKFYSSVRVELENIGKLKEGKQVIGVNTKATIVKNRFAPPYRSVVLPMYYEDGIDEAEAVLNLLKDLELAVVGGAWYTCPLTDGAELKFQRKDFADLFDKHFDDFADLLEDVL